MCYLFLYPTKKTKLSSLLRFFRLMRFAPVFDNSMIKQFLASTAVITSLFFNGFALAGDIERQQAKRIHDRLTGTPPDNATLDTLEALIISNGAEAAADEAMLNPDFYNVTLKNFIAPWTNEEQSVFVPLNDYTATAIGMIRDEIDFREILSGNILYTGNTSTLSISPYANGNNNHYEELEELGPVLGDLSNPLILQKKTQTEITNLPDEATAGIMTTRAAAKAFFTGGTNRAMFRFTLINHLCTDLEQLKDITRVPDRIYRDVTRSPGGDSRIFMNNCIGCHAGMDGFNGAYAHYTYNESSQQLDYTPTTVAEKHNINQNNFKYGHITTDDSWVNYWRNGQNALLEWGTPDIPLDENGHSSGNGASSMGTELAKSEAFGLCQVKKVFQAMCFRNSDDYEDDHDEVERIADDFKLNGYNMKRVFAKTVAYCKGS